MSDSEAEFESADEGSKGDGGWEIDCDYDLPDVQHLTVDPERNGMTCKQHADVVEPSGKDSATVDPVPTIQSRLDKLAPSDNNTNRGPQISEESKVIQNEIKSPTTPSNSWGGWSSGWSVNSFLSTASAISNQVSQGITNVIGAPAPEQLATVDKETVDTSDDKPIEESPLESISGTNYFLSNVSQITKIVETTGNKIINGGLDTLETVGKKTLEVLQEGDPGFHKKRAIFFQNTKKLNLSQILQEAKEKAELESKQNNQVEIKKGYAYMLDSFQGLIHLESLELLSKQCQMKLQTVLLSYSGTQLIDIQDRLDEIKESFRLDCDDDEKLITGEEFKNYLITCVNQISIDVKTEKILRVSDVIDEKSNGQFDGKGSIHDEAISALAELTAAAIELYYKLGEMLMIDTQNKQAIIKSENLSLLNEAVCCRICSIANKYACLLTKFDAESTSNNISDIYLESSNSTSYVQDAAQLLLPILQLSTI